MVTRCVKSLWFGFVLQDVRRGMKPMKQLLLLSQAPQLDCLRWATILRRPLRTLRHGWALHSLAQLAFCLHSLAKNLHFCPSASIVFVQQKLHLCFYVGHCPLLCIADLCKTGYTVFWLVRRGDWGFSCCTETMCGFDVEMWCHLINVGLHVNWLIPIVLVLDILSGVA
jgi:hypothetical protein